MVYEYVEWNDEALSELDRESKEYLEENIQNQPRVPVAYLNEGKYRIRIWPDRDSKGRPRVMRHVFIQRLHDNQFYLASDQIGKVIDESQEVKDELKRFARQEISLLMCQIVSVEPENQFVKPDTDVCIVLRQAGTFSLHSFMASLSSDEKRQFLNTKAPAIPITITVTNGGFNVKMEINPRDSVHVMREMSLPAESEWEGLDRIYIPVDKIVTEELFHAFRRAVGEIKVKKEREKDSRISDPTPAPTPTPTTSAQTPTPAATKPRESPTYTAGMSQPSPQSPASLPNGNAAVTTQERETRRDPETPAVTETKTSSDPLNPIGKTGLPVCGLRNAFSEFPEYRERYGKHGFGYKPGPEEVLTECIVCSVEYECGVATSKRQDS